MSTPDLFPTPSVGAVADRKVMNGKPVHLVPAQTVINFKSGFGHKLLCDSLTFSAGSACAYSCSFCYVEDLMRKSPHMKGIDRPLPEVVIRRDGAAAAARKQLTDAKGRPKFKDAGDRRVIYASPLVDVAANMELVRETVDICKVILELTNWNIRLLSKSNLLPRIAVEVGGWGASGKSIADMNARGRIIYGVSTGTLDDKLASAFESGTPLVSKRIQSLHWLQDNGFRTFGMICPSLPQKDYDQFAVEMSDALRSDRCEHVWAEGINARGASFTRTHAALLSSGHTWEADALHVVSHDKIAWEQYARNTFEAHAAEYAGQLGADGTPKLRFLQYVTAASKTWWKEQEPRGAVLL